MLIKQKQLNLLGLAQRASKLQSGEEIVLNEIRKGTAQLVLVANDSSENTKKKIEDKCRYYNVALFTDFTTVEMSQALGKKRSIIAICDRGFALSFQKLIEQSKS